MPCAWRDTMRCCWFTDGPLRHWLLGVPWLSAWLSDSVPWGLTEGSNSLRGHNRYSESYPVGSQHSVGAPIASGGTTAILRKLCYPVGSSQHSRCGGSNRPIRNSLSAQGLRGHNRYSRESYPVGSQHSVGAPIASGGTTVTPKVAQWARNIVDLLGKPSLCALPGSLTWPARTHLWSHHRIQHHAPLARSAEMAHAEPGSAARTALRF